MTVKDWAGPLYPETPVEIYLDFDPVFSGSAEDARLCGYSNRQVEEVYISIDGTKLIISVEHDRRIKKK